MSRLTLEWHLRGIVEGTVEPVRVRTDLENYSESSERWWSGKSYYADPHVEGNREQRSSADAGSYTTGFTQESGDYCDAFDVPASKALRSDDPVAFLDAVANDPIRPHQERYDAAQLLDYHIWPDSPRSHENGVIPVNRDDVDVSEWTEAGMVRKGIGPTYFAMRCVQEGCMEGECLSDPDILRDEGRPVCMVCGSEQPEPTYP